MTTGGLLSGRKVWLGLAVSLACLGLALRGVDWSQFWAALAAGRWQWLLLALPLYLVGYWSRARRVAQLLEPVKKVSSSRVLPPLVIGFLFNNILPARLGEFVFAHLLGTREGVPRTASFAVVVLSRILDGITIVTFFLFGLFAFLELGAVPDSTQVEVLGTVFSQQELLGKVYLAGILGALLFALVSAGCFLLIVRKDWAFRTIETILAVFPARFSASGKTALEKFIAGLSILKDPGRLFGVFLFNFVPWGLELFTYYFGARVFGLELTIRESALVMGMTNLAMIAPGAPGGVGLFEAGGMMVMALLNVEKGLALAYITMVHVIILLPINLWGAYFLWREGISFQEALQGSGPEKRRRHG